MNPAHPGMQFHRLSRTRDRRFWSMRVVMISGHCASNRGILLLCYVGHHDQAYSWAERRKLETHPKTGCAAVEIREVTKGLLYPNMRT